MIDKMQLKGNPFYLEDEDIVWVEKTLASLSRDDKVGQLFCVALRSGEREELQNTYRVLNPGCIHFRPQSIEESMKFWKNYPEFQTVPALIGANLERGGDGVATEGTLFSSPMGIAATGDVAQAEKLGEICGREGAAVGENWAFAPIVDIDYNWRNPIMNVRTFGSDPTVVAQMGAAYVRGIQAQGVAGCAKHFPGDGRDERDQHLAVTINDLSCEDWDATYGQAYAACIDAGVMSVMIGHIIQMGYERKFRPEAQDAELLPASLSPVIMKKLLREKLGFNGVIATDATTMAGFYIPMPRAQAVPTTIQNGADIFLCPRNLEEDYAYMREGLENGLLTEERLDEAVTRILAMKAALKLHKKTYVANEAYAREVIGCDAHRVAARACAEQAITLVKEEAGVLPITPERYPRVLLYGIETTEKAAFLVESVGIVEQFRQRLEQAGFSVDVYERYVNKEGEIPPFQDAVDRYDLILYLASLTTKSNQTVVRIEWMQPFGSNTPIYTNSVPTVFISTENPYHLVDVPRVKTFINAYSTSAHVLDVLMDKLAGKSSFVGKSPVDPFCGFWDAHL